MIARVLRLAVALSLMPGLLAAQQIPVRKGLALLYAHKNFQQEEFQLLVEVLEANPKEMLALSRFLDEKRAGAPLEEPVSRREMAGARTIGLGRMGSDTTNNRPRTIAMASQRLMRELRAGGQVRASVPIILDGQSFIFDGTMSRVSTDPEYVDAVVEGAPLKLRTLHARGEFENVVRGFRMTADWWFLDDTTDAWIVKTSATNNRRESFYMVLASADADGSRQGLEEGLARDCRAAVYGFYFGFGSASPEPSSQQTFRMVADILTRHPDWTLTVEGHTDSIGNPTANRQLAERRAAAVVRELSSTYRIAPARLTPTGYGANRPAAPNTTLEGRARNRRVELVRPCDRRS